MGYTHSEHLGVFVAEGFFGDDDDDVLAVLEDEIDEELDYSEDE